MQVGLSSLCSMRVAIFMRSVTEKPHPPRDRKYARLLPHLADHFVLVVGGRRYRHRNTAPGSIRASSVDIGEGCQLWHEDSLRRISQTGMAMFINCNADNESANCQA